MGFLSRWRVNLECLATIMRGRHLFVAWLLTYRCNFRCNFCEFFKMRAAKELDPGELEHLYLAKLRPLGVRVVNFSGGEPLLRKDLPEIVARFSRHANVILNTNGSLVEPHLARELWRSGLDVANVSIDFLDPHKHDANRGVPGAWQKAWRAVRILSEERSNPRQIVTVQSILMPDNVGELDGLIRMSAEHGASFATNPCRRSAHGHELPPGGAVQASATLADLRRRYPKHLRITPYAIEKTREFYEVGRVAGCCAGKYMLAVNPAGEIMPCENRHDATIENPAALTPGELAARLCSFAGASTCDVCYGRERSELEYAFQPMSLEKIRYLLSEAKS